MNMSQSRFIAQRSALIQINIMIFLFFLALSVLRNIFRLEDYKSGNRIPSFIIFLVTASALLGFVIFHSILLFIIPKTMIEFNGLNLIIYQKKNQPQTISPQNIIGAFGKKQFFSGWRQSDGRLTLQTSNGDINLRFVSDFQNVIQNLEFIKQATH